MNEPMIERLNTALQGRYHIDRELGAGGMATVFLADDIRHDRKVALKVLKPELAAVVGAERFLAEIKTTANLQHPHILPLFDSGEADGFLFYVMPYVEGESLREKLDREKQLSVDEAVDIAEKVASALEYAHEQDIVHRDVKPANILMSRGEPLVADFGIALALSEAGGGRITETGLSLGTPHYMSPEQASGDQSLDKRSDVYALGCILYEMLTGEPPYGGPTAQSVLAKILTGDARRITELRRTVPLNVDAAVAKALEKLPADRFASAEAFVRALENEGFRHVARESAPAGRRKAAGGGWLAGRGGLIAAVVAAVVLGLLAGFLLRPAPGPEPMFMASVGLGADRGLMDVPFGAPMALSADGETLVYAGPAEVTGWRLWVRRAGALQATPLPGTSNAFTPTFSPDGNAVAFSQGASVKVLTLGTGTVRTLVDDAAFIADWSDEGYIYYLANTSSDFNRVPAGGGTVEVVPGLTPREGTAPSAAALYSFGDVLPGGRTGVWTVVPVSANASQLTVVWIDLETGETRELARGFSPKYLESGHLVWASPEGTLVAARFDPKAGEFTGPPVQIVEGVSRDGQGGAHAAYSQTGDLVFRMGSSQAGELQLAWVDRDSGTPTPVDSQWTILPITIGNWSGVALSPDGSRLVTTDGGGGGGQLWIKELDSGTPPYRITFDGDFHVRPRWMADGRSVSFISSLGGEDAPTQVWARAADGSGTPWQLAVDDVEIEEAVVSPDGRWLVYRRGGTTANRDIYALRLGQDSVATPLVATEADEKSPQISPDGRWLAYSSDETGQQEVFVRPFPDVDGGRWQISRGGGSSPVWANNGRELFYVGASNGVGMMAAELAFRESSLSVTNREALFPVTNLYTDTNYPAFDTDLSDQRFLMFQFGGGGEGTLVWVRNWTTDWERRAGRTR